MCLLKWCCCGCSLTTAAKAIVLFDFLWVVFYCIWAILSTIVLKTIQKIKNNYISENPDDEQIITTLVWSILVVSLATPLVGLIAFFTNFKARQVLAYLIARILAQVAHLGLFLFYLSYMGSKDLLGVLITFCWLSVCTYLNWVLLSYFKELSPTVMKKKRKRSSLSMLPEGRESQKKMFITQESFTRKVY